MSDLHLEFREDEGEEFISQLTADDCDVLALAGDITAGKNRIKRTLERFVARGFKHIVYVFGNHEYYGSSAHYLRNSIKKWLNEQEYDHVHFLENEVAEIEGVSFVGTTMWFADTAETRAFQFRMNDFRQIKQFNSYIWHANKIASKFLAENVSEGCVVVTHHAPTHKSLYSGFRGSKLNCFYISDQADIILDQQPALWFHGHMHDPNDYMVGECNVKSNPFGYWKHEWNQNWQEEIVEI